MRRALLLGLLAGCAHRTGAPVAAPPPAAVALPPLGTEALPLPEGEGRELAAAACLPCHSADILRQQRITARQWAASVDKMVRWGAPVRDADKERLVAYLARNFGPDNDRFTPLEVAPLAR